VFCYSLFCLVSTVKRDLSFAIVDLRFSNDKIIHFATTRISSSVFISETHAMLQASQDWIFFFIFFLFSMIFAIFV
jgi:hypothetical protein